MILNQLLERDAELGLLEMAIARAVAGEGGVVAIEGVAGIGKTALLRALVDLARQKGIDVLRARGVERERELPFGGVRQLFEPTLRRLEGQQREALLAGAAQLAAPVVLADELAEEPPRAAASLLHGLYWLLANLSDRAPVVLTLDDAHWSDRASLAFARYIAQRLEDMPVVLAVSVRTTDREAQLDDVQMLIGAASTTIRPRPLSAAAVTALVRDRLGGDAADEFCDACHAATGGNPFFLRELLVELEREAVEPSGANAGHVSDLAPASVSRAVLARINRLPAQAMRLAESLAVQGDPAELRPVALLAGIEQDTAANAVDDLARSGIIEPGRPLAFQHPILRAAVYDSLAAATRIAMHADAARLLTAGGAPPEQSAVHLLRTDGRGDPDAVDTLRAAARRSLSRGAADSAARYLRRALSEPPAAELRPAVLHELGQAELRAGELAAVDRLELALDQNRDSGARAAIAHDLARALLMSGASGAAIEVLDREGAVASASDREAGLRFEAESLSVTWVERGASGVAPERIERARALAGATAGERAVLAAVVPLVAAAGEVSAGDIAELCERALGAGQLLAEQTSESPQFVLVPQELAYADRLTAAARHLDQGIEDARRRGSAMGFFFCAGMRSMVAYRRGELSDAVLFATEAVDAARQHGWVASFPTGAALLADALIEQGELDAAEAVLGEAEPATEPLTRRGALMFNQVRYRRATLSLARGNPQHAVNELLALDEEKRRIGDLNPGRHPWLATLALALAAADDTTRARSYAREALERSRRWGTNSAIGIALRADAHTYTGTTRIDRLRKAVAALEDSPARLEHARALLDLGTSYADTGNRTEARDALRAALDIGDACGATTLAVRAHTECIAAGGRPRRPRTTGTKSLTPSERRVAEMAAAGQSNPEIAQSLFLTRKTIETHLSNAYKKLAIQSRSELPEALQE